MGFYQLIQKLEQITLFISTLHNKLMNGLSMGFWQLVLKVAHFVFCFFYKRCNITSKAAPSLKQDDYNYIHSSRVLHQLPERFQQGVLSNTG